MSKGLSWTKQLIHFGDMYSTEMTKMELPTWINSSVTRTILQLSGKCLTNGRKTRTLTSWSSQESFSMLLIATLKNLMVKLPESMSAGTISRVTISSSVERMMRIPMRTRPTMKLRVQLKLPRRSLTRSTLMPVERSASRNSSRCTKRSLRRSETRLSIRLLRYLLVTLSRASKTNLQT